MSALALQSFGFEGQTVRAMEQDGCPWFVAQDVCACLEIGNHRDAVSRLDDDERDGVGITDAMGRPQEQIIISESGLYALIFKSRKPAAVRFRKWVTSVVLPALRTTGRFELVADNDQSELLGLDHPDEMERFKVKLALVREARHVYGRLTARTIWEQVGLPQVAAARHVPQRAITTEADPVIDRWLCERCLQGPALRIEATALFHDYEEWCAEHNIRPESQAYFGRQLSRMGFEARKGSIILRQGLALKD